LQVAAPSAREPGGSASLARTTQPRDAPSAPSSRGESGSLDLAGKASLSGYSVVQPCARHLLAILAARVNAPQVWQVWQVWQVCAECSGLRCTTGCTFQLRIRIVRTDPNAGPERASDNGQRTKVQVVGCLRSGHRSWETVAPYLSGPAITTRSAAMPRRRLSHS